MTGEELIAGIGFAEDELVQEAEEKRLRMRTLFPWKSCIAAAACLTVFAGSAAVWMMQNRGAGSEKPPVQEYPVITAESGRSETEADGNKTEEPVLYVGNPAAETATPEMIMPEAALEGEPGKDAVTPVITIDRSSIVLNEMEAIMDPALQWYDPDQYRRVLWDEEDIAAYYGKDPAPAYVPEGLILQDSSPAEAIFDQDGMIVQDRVSYGYYHDYHEDGSPRLTEEVPAWKGLTVTVSRLGITGDAVYVMPEDEGKVSDIHGNEVLFGYRSMPCGPYDPQTKEPLGYYDLYAARFVKNGIYYEIIAYQMELDEVVKVAASVLFEEAEIAVQ